MPRGKEHEWTQEERRAVQDYVCDQIALGRALVNILRDADKDLPNYNTVMEWRRDDPEFGERYAHAREAQADYYADEIASIADTEEDPNRARVRIEARKWAASKLKPKLYGDRLQLDADVSVTVPDAQLESRIAHLFGKAGAIAAPRGEGET